MIRACRRFFESLSLYYKILLSYFALIIIPIAIFFILTNNYIKTSTIDNTVFATKQSFIQSYNYLDYKIYGFIKTNYIISYSNNIIKILSKSKKNYSINDQFVDYDYLKTFLLSIRDKEDIFDVKVYVQEGLIYSNEGNYTYNFEKAKDSVWYQKMVSDNSNFLCSPNSYLEKDETSNTNVLSVIHLLSHPDDYTLKIGAVRVDFPENDIKDILVSNEGVKNSLTYIQNSNGDIVTTSNENLQNKLMLESADISQLSDEEFPSAIITKNGTKYFALAKEIKSTDWTLISISPFSEIEKASKKATRNMIINLFIIIVLAYFLAYYIAFSIMKRLSLLSENMKNVKNGKLCPINVKNINNDIEELIGSYNYMIEEMNLLIQNNFENGKKLKENELKILHAQINPHFLYNTLDMIKWFATQNKTDQISATINSLAKFYKLSLSKGKDVITIKDEIEHVSHYFQIQNMRFDGKINLNIEVPNEILPHMIPKLTIQPIVENAILHGILNKDDQTGTITIKAEFVDNDIEISVKDDGIGIPKDKIATSIMGMNLQDKQDGGFGLKNTNDRLKLHYGSNYGVTIKSKCPGYTLIIIRIPKTE